MKKLFKAGLAVLTVFSLAGCGQKQEKQEKKKEPVVTLCKLSGIKLSVKAANFTEADVVKQADAVLKANGADVPYSRLTDAYCKEHFKDSMNLKSKQAVHEYAKLLLRRSSARKLAKAKNEAMEEYLLKNCKVSFVPEELVGKEKDKVQKSYALFASLEKKPLSEYAKTQGYASLEDFRQKTNAEAPKRAKLDLIEDAVVIKKDIRVSRDEMEQLAGSYKKAGIPPKKLYDCYGGQAAFAASCRRARALQKLVDDAEFEEE